VRPVNINRSDEGVRVALVEKSIDGIEGGAEADIPLITSPTSSFARERA
jgi:hypothetical protein